MWWWRLFVFAESARRRILFLLSLEHPCSDYLQIFAVFKLALGNLLAKKNVFELYLIKYIKYMNQIQIQASLKIQIEIRKIQIQTGKYKYVFDPIPG